MASFNPFSVYLKYAELKIKYNHLKNDYDKLKEQYYSKERLPIWGVVRYRNNKFDCVWTSGLTKREADKYCYKLNSDYHKNYGEYVVEMNP